jgi:hypothetical protein
MKSDSRFSTMRIGIAARPGRRELDVRVERDDPRQAQAGKVMVCRSVLGDSHRSTTAFPQQEWLEEQTKNKCSLYR